MDQEFGPGQQSYRADRKGIQPRTVKGMDDERWAVFTGAAERDGLTVAAWLYRAAMTYITGQPLQHSRSAVPPDIEAAHEASRDIALPTLALPAPSEASRHTDVAAELKDAEYLEKLAALSVQAAGLEKQAAGTLNAIVRKKLKAYRADLLRADRHT